MKIWPKMTNYFEFEAVIAARLGIHARTAEAISSIADLTEGEVRISSGNIKANAKSISSVLGLAATVGTRLKISVQISEGYERCVQLMKEAIEDPHLTERFSEYCHPFRLKLEEERLVRYA